MFQRINKELCIRGAPAGPDLLLDNLALLFVVEEVLHRVLSGPVA